MDTKKIRWFHRVAFIAFNMVWGMGNVVNNFAQQGITVCYLMAVNFALCTLFPMHLLLVNWVQLLKIVKVGQFMGLKIPVRNAWLIMPHGLIG